MGTKIVLSTTLMLLAAGAIAQAPDLEAMDIVLRSVPDGPVAKVEGANIERSQFIRFYQEELTRVLREQNAHDIPDTVKVQLARLCLTTLVERELLYREALRRELTVPEESVQKAWAAQLAQIRQATAAREGRDLSEEDILARLGYAARDEILADLRRALITEKMRATVIHESGLSISDEEVARVLQSEGAKFVKPARLHLKQIFINPERHTSEGDDPTKLAQQALDRLYAGQSFDAVAKALSDSPDRVRGGDMGSVPVNQLPPFMADAAETMRPEDISEVIESEYGYHIIMLVERADPPEVSMQAAGSLARRQLLTKEGSKVVHDFCDALIQNGTLVKVFLELDKNLALSRAPSGGRDP